MQNPDLAKYTCCPDAAGALKGITHSSSDKVTQDTGHLPARCSELALLSEMPKLR